MIEIMHPYRTHTCGELREDHIDQTVRLSGWIHRKRDHGNLVFIDLRDHFGLSQCVIDVSSELFPIVEGARPESVLTVTGPVVARTEETVNANIDTGKVEVRIREIVVENSPISSCSGVDLWYRRNLIVGKLLLIAAGS